MKFRFVTKGDILSMDNRKDIFVFGAGNLGSMTAKFLILNGANFKGYCLDDIYYKIQNKSSGGYISISELSKRSENTYELFYALGSVNRMKRLMHETWRKEVLIIWDPWITLERDRLCLDQYADELLAVRDLWEDDLSRKTQDGFIKALKTGDGCEDIKNFQPDTYFNDLTTYLQFMDGGFVDCGAYDGDSIGKYLNFVGDRKQTIWAFEPDMDNYYNLKNNFGGKEYVKCIPKGVWDSETRLHFLSGNGEASSVNVGGEVFIDVTTIDKVVKTEKVACIKMDVEGSELNALRGAAKVICRDYPMLLISAYHKVNDLITLPQYIRSIDIKRKYKFYLRHHACTRPELVVYGIPD